MEFKSLVVYEREDGSFEQKIEKRDIDSLPEGDVLVRVHYAALNFKDALSCTGNKGVTRNYPHTPGIDAVGVIESSNSDEFSIGESVIVTSYDLGMNTSGAFSEYIRVPKEWVIKLPENLTLKEAGTYGTGALTAGLSLYKLEQNGITPKSGKILVTGSTGGVGSFAVSILAKAGYEVVAMSGKADKIEFLKEMGASEVIGRDVIDVANKRALLKPLFAGCIDTVGGDILASIFKYISYGGSVTNCGLVASPAINTTVFPFILRGINLLGIDSAETPRELRCKIWEKLSNEWKVDTSSITTEHSLEDLPELVQKILKGKLSGRAVIKLI